ncbi:flavin reductase family protein [Streptomyces sp. NPDC051243]|uniref:flavin reductase family protein n=1 Tax=Streptomyces sp. NPDC051243 TaxID=3365646 RepID=UPI0037882D30
MTAPHEASGAALFREVLGHFCTGVVVVAGCGPDGPAGLTCQSFGSLSLDPPLVMFGVARTSTSWPLIRHTGSICVNVLAEDQREVSARMARSGADKFAGIDWEPTPLGAPRLRGALAWLDCTLHAEYPGGDHTVVVARVHRSAVASEAPPLLYYRGSYAALNSGRSRKLRLA